MAIHYHHKTLALLHWDDTVESSVNPELVNWIKKYHIQLPEAYIEWCRIKQSNEILHYYSNEDRFYLYTPELIKSPMPGHIVEFMSENQGNFSLGMILLDKSENSPVVFYRGDDDEIRYAESFSDYIYTQIFDWQYLISVVNGETSLGYCEGMSFNSYQIVYEYLTHMYENGPITHFYNADRQPYTEYRFFSQQEERINLIVSENNATAELRITASNPIKCKRLYSLLSHEFKYIKN